MQANTSFRSTLAVRERYRDQYWRNNDPIGEDRLLWRAQTFRHAVHLFPGQTILELGCGEGLFTGALLRVCRGENPITAVTFQEHVAGPPDIRAKVELLEFSDFSSSLRGRRFDCIVAMDLVDRHDASHLLKSVYELLEPGGKMVFYESNPLNPFLALRRLFLRVSGRQDPRRLLSRSQLYRMLAGSGFVDVYAVYNHFVFAPLTRRLIWLLRNLSILLENAPGVQAMAGSILVHAQKPPGGMAAPSEPRGSLPSNKTLTFTSSLLCGEQKRQNCVSAIDSKRRTFWIADAHRDNGKRFVVHAEEMLTALVELESAIRVACYSPPLHPAVHILCKKHTLIRGSDVPM